MVRDAGRAYRPARTIRDQALECVGRRAGRRPATACAMSSAAGLLAIAADLRMRVTVPGGGQDLVGVLADEFAPGALAAARRRRQAMATEHLAHGEMGAAVAELEQLALDAAVAPPRALTRPGGG